MKPVQKLSKELPFIQEIENLKKEVDAHRPLNKDIQDRVFQKLRLDWNYNTNAIEGNSFTRGETVSLLMEGITAKGKPLKDALDIKGHNDAIDIVISLIKDERELNENDIRNLHKIVLGEEYYNPATTAEGNSTRKLIKPGQYKTSSNHVETSTGAIHYYASVEDTPLKMRELIGWYNEVVKFEDVNPVVLAALFHHKFVAIHPFDDGNGRMTRLLTNYILLKFGYPVSVVKQERRREYYATLAQADAGELIPIVELISETVKDSLEVYLKAIKGEEINETDDIDKEIELFIKSFDNDDLLKEVKEEASVERIMKDFYLPFFNGLKSSLDKFNSLFLLVEYEVIINSSVHKIGKDYELNVLYDGEFYFYKKNRFKDEMKNPEDKINIRLDDVQSINFLTIFKGFKKDKHQRDLTIDLSFRFDKNRYDLIDNLGGGKLFSKFYHENISRSTRLEIIKHIIKESLIKKIKDWSE